jgi:hypothetical protein
MVQSPRQKRHMDQKRQKRHMDQKRHMGAMKIMGSFGV